MIIKILFTQINKGYNEKALTSFAFLISDLFVHSKSGIVRNFAQKFWEKMSFRFLKELFLKNVLMTTAIAKHTCSVKYTAAGVLYTPIFYRNNAIKTRGSFFLKI